MHLGFSQPMLIFSIGSHHVDFVNPAAFGLKAIRLPSGDQDEIQSSLE